MPLEQFHVGRAIPNVCVASVLQIFHLNGA